MRIDAEVTVRFKIKNTGDLEADMPFGSFHEYILMMIVEEGLWGIVENNFDVIQVERIGVIESELP